ncbi:MAG: SIMPL domain-containing protein [Roseburia sp.]|nr:SIMPL domain-containing protein [Roseburia sp.]
MPRTITVKGIGRASARPDTVVLSMSLDSRDKDYDKAMEIAADNIEDITRAVIAAGFEKEALKTTDFNVRTEYESVKGRDGNYRQEFRGYVVSHNLKVEFGFDVKRLSKALSAIAGCASHPQLSISFVVKDTAAVNEEMLRSAAENARKKAEILCDASGGKLGKLLTIDYSWSEINICSDTGYRLAEECYSAPMMAREIEIEPDDVDVSDTATFVWEMD